MPSVPSTLVSKGGGGRAGDGDRENGWLAGWLPGTLSRQPGVKSVYVDGWPGICLLSVALACWVLSD